MKHRYTYHIKFWLDSHASDEQELDVIAESKADAWEKATFEIIPEKYGKCPYSAFVASVTYANGNTRRFNTCHGLAY